jgi:uncharacterized protein
MSASVKLDELESWFGECAFAIVAFSGGVDSSLIAHLAKRFLGGAGCLAVISDSPSLKRSELRSASAFCQRHDIPFEIIHTDELNDPRYASNPGNRCFYCKQTLYRELQAVAARYPGSWLMNGTNLDDLGDYRPGLEAATQFEIRSPLAECGLTKSCVRRIALELQLECWDKPASPCLSSRIAYGQPVTATKLRQIELAEELVTQRGFRIARVRHLGLEARLEVPKEDIRRLMDMLPELQPSLLALGFERLTVDTEGFVSGKLNRLLENSPTVFQLSQPTSPKVVP